MKTLKDYLSRHEGDKAFDHLIDIWRDYGEHAAHETLRQVVCENYWKQSGEYFILEGALGWGPGHREEYDGDEEREVPPMANNALLQLHMFVHRLSRLTPTPLNQHFRSAPDGPAKSFYDRLIQLPAIRRHRGVDTVYSAIATSRAPYALGAARPFLKMWLDLGQFEQAVAGLVMILVHGISRKTAMKEVAQSLAPLAVVVETELAQRKLSVAC